MAPGDALTTPYVTAMPYVNTKAQSWLGSDYEEQRLQSYDLYDDMYRNSPNVYSMMLRGSDNKPIFIPTAKRIINTLARYVGKNWGYSILTGSVDAEGEAIPLEPADSNAALEALGSLFVRERILAQFSSGKKDFLARGDWIWYIGGDMNKPLGRRLTVKTIDPRTYFVIQDDVEDLDRVTGAEIIEETLVDEKQNLVGLKVQRWLKPSAAEYDPTWGEEIAYSCEIYEVGNYGDPEKRKLMQTLTDLAPLPNITAMPLYHIRNNETVGNPFGTSDLSGLESLVAGINQTISDEDLALAMQGLGMFWTNATGPDGGWVLGPEQVVEVGAGHTFEKIDGIRTVDPSQKHVAFLQDEAYGVNGLSDVAMGTSETAEAGIALALRLQPLFDTADDKDMLINGTMDQMFFDLANIWFPLYENVDFTGLIIKSTMDPEARIPFDRASAFNELMSLFTDKIVPVEYVCNRLNEKFGYDISATDVQKAVDAIQAADVAAQDAAVQARTAAEIANASA